MARRVVVEVQCDVCGAKVRDTEAQNVRIIIEQFQYEVDVCAGCQTQLGTYVQAARQVPKSEYMRYPEQKPRKSHRATEPYLPTAATDVAAERPRVVPCPVKGCKYMGVDNRAVGVHKRREHGIEGGKK